MLFQVSIPTDKMLLKKEILNWILLLNKFNTAANLSLIRINVVGAIIIHKPKHKLKQ